MQTITDAELRSERDRFTKAYLEGDKVTFTNIMNSHINRLGITNKDVIRMGIDLTAMSRWRQGKRTPTEKGMETLTNMLIRHEKPKCASEKTTNEILFNDIAKETGYTYSYEWEMDFGITLNRISTIKRYNKPTKEMKTEKFCTSLEAEWPDVSTIQDLLTEKPVDLDLLIEKLINNLINKVSSGLNKLNMHSLSEYLMSERRIPRMLYDEIINTINELPELILTNIPGYKEWRIDILTKLWYGKTEEAEKSFRKMVKANFVSEIPVEVISSASLKLFNQKTRETGVLYAIKVFDKTCMTLYRNLSDDVQRKAFALCQRKATITRISLFGKKGMVEQLKNEVNAVRFLPNDQSDVIRYAAKHDKTYMPYALRDLSRTTFTKARMKNTITSVETIFDYLEEWLKENPKIKFAYM